MIIIHYLFFTNFSIFMNVLQYILFNTEEFYKQEFKIKSARNKIYLHRLRNINDYKIYSLYCERSESTPDRALLFIAYIFSPLHININKIIKKHVNGLEYLLLNAKGAKLKVAQGVRNIRSIILFNLSQSSAYEMGDIYKSNFTIPTSYRKFYFNSRLSNELHKMKKRSVSNEDYYTNYDLLYLSDRYPLLPHTASANDLLPNDGILKNSTIQNFFVRQNVRKIVAENSHLTLNCPETTMDSNVQWYKDNERLNSSFRRNMADAETEPHLTIDAYNSLYILQATKNEEGVYTCFVNDKPFQTYVVIVVSKSKLLNEEFFRYSIYLGFVLSLTITCYCAGICVAWHQRSSFADPLR